MMRHFVLPTGFAKEFHQHVLNQMDESVNCYMTVIDSVSCPELKTGECYYFGGYWNRFWSAEHN